MCAICRAARRGDHAGVIVAARNRLGLTQTGLGQRVGLSHSEVSRLENRKRALRDVTVLRRFAVALDLPGAVFGLDVPAGRRVCGEPTRGEDTVERRDLLTALVALAAGAVLPTSAATEQTRYRTVAALRVGLVRTRSEFDACRYATVGRRLPALVTSGHQLLAAHSGQARELAESALADIYSLAAFTADKTGEFTVAWVLADRARTHAAASGDPVSIATATRETAVAMRRAGHHDQATDLLTTAAAGLDGGNGWELAGRGSLLLTAAYTHAQRGHSATALALADEAADVAGRLPARWPANSMFTAAQVPIYRIGIHNALGDPARALTVARGIPLGALPTAERRARVCLDVARAWFAYGNAHRCLLALRLADGHAPEEVRRPQTQRLTRELLGLPGRPPDGLRAFATMTGAV